MNKLIIAAVIATGCASVPVRHIDDQDPDHSNTYRETGRWPGSPVVKTLLGSGIQNFGNQPGTAGTFSTVKAGDGTAGAPAFELQGHSGTGFYWDTGSGLATFSSAGAARWQYGSGAIIPFTNGGLSLGLSGTRWSTVFSGLFTSGVSSGNKGFAIENNGAFIDFGAGATDDASSDGTTVTFRGPLASAGNVSGASVTASGANGFNGTSATALFQASAANGIAALEGNATDGAAATGIKLGNGVALTAGIDRYVATFYRDNLSTVVSRVSSDGTYMGGLAADGTHLSVSKTAPTISSGFGTSPSIVASNGSLAFQVNVGTGGVATSGVIGLPTATTGWVCKCDDITTESTTVTYTKQTASSTTTCTVGSFSDIAGASAWVASDKLNCIAAAY